MKYTVADSSHFLSFILRPMLSIHILSTIAMPSQIYTQSIPIVLCSQGSRIRVLPPLPTLSPLTKPPLLPRLNNQPQLSQPLRELLHHLLQPLTAPFLIAVPVSLSIPIPIPR